MTRSLARPEWARCVLTSIIFAFLTLPLTAQDKFCYFYHSKKHDPSAWTSDVTLRPNHGTSQYLFVVAPEEMIAGHVELQGPDGKVWARSGTLKFEAKGEIKLVEFQKPEAAKPATPAPAAPTGDAAAPKAATPPPPPGKSLPASKVDSKANSEQYGFAFDLVLYKDTTRDGKVQSTLVKKQNIAINVLTPERYLDVNAVATADGIRLTVKPQESSLVFRDGTPSVVTLTLPPQDSLNVQALGAGSYRRTIASLTDSAVLESRELPIIARKGENATIRFCVDVDGYQRAFVFEPTLTDFTQAASSNSQLILSTEGAARIYPGNTLKPAKANDRFTTRPVAKAEERYPVRLEFDNADNAKPVKFGFDRGGQANGNSGTPGKDEVEFLPGPRDSRIWMETAGDDGQMIFTNTLTDWVVPLDTFQMRGAHKLTAEMEDRNQKTVTHTALLVLDDTVPHLIKILDLPDTQVKGQPFKVSASVQDKETGIKRVVFFIGPPPGPDGKRASEPIKVEGTLVKQANVWTAELPLPADAKGLMQVGLVATNDVGLEVTETKNIKLVDAPPPAGNLHVKVLRGSRPQEGITVKLKDAEGKEKSVAVTDAKGIARFNQLPPGSYGVAADKPDSGAGSKGIALGKVEVNATTEVTITLRRGNP
ncbi:MAG: carboxypeptidase-like regulatory domain-containing protein [Gemmatales bacterium]